MAGYITLLLSGQCLIHDARNLSPGMSEPVPWHVLSPGMSNVVVLHKPSGLGMDLAKVQKLFGLTSGKYRKYRKQAKILRR